LAFIGYNHTRINEINFSVSTGLDKESLAATSMHFALSPFMAFAVKVRVNFCSCYFAGYSVSISHDVQFISRKSNRKINLERKEGRKITDIPRGPQNKILYSKCLREINNNPFFRKKCARGEALYLIL